MGEYERGFKEKTKASLVKTLLTPCMEAACKTKHAAFIRMNYSAVCGFRLRNTIKRQA